ncbi:unnamed protein product [Closterium sp. Yama58-4]|nr:unnamed protein product [Closterium sp. Yama58-4]
MSASDCDAPKPKGRRAAAAAAAALAANASLEAPPIPRTATNSSAVSSCSAASAASAPPSALKGVPPVGGSRGHSRSRSHGGLSGRLLSRLAQQPGAELPADAGAGAAAAAPSAATSAAAGAAAVHSSADCGAVEGGKSGGGGGRAEGLPMLPPPDAPQIVKCQSCNKSLAVPPNLPPPGKGYQRLRCGKCLHISKYALYSPPSTAAATAAGSDLGRVHKEEGEGREGEEKEAEEYGMAGAMGGPMGAAGMMGPLGEEGGYSRRVVVNSVPITDPAVARAEELAGPIHPGSYWYDVHAGFWGVMGGPCLGIIPAGIWDLALAPLLRHCSNGHTRVLVNGRELQRRDLDILMQRGLLDHPGAAYLLDIHGNLADATNGEPLPCLGKLAPSLELKGRGAGMYVPKQPT